ncbi:methylase [Kurthia gibsonii]|uniref:methylase n=1 Tax=Kurthia gibsonii TaxID=33946 RepID=UPI003F213197
MNLSDKYANEKIIKSKKRIQNHGEVFTPKRIVNNMLDLPNIREACENLTSTFLEPAAGEGIFLVEILRRKLALVKKSYGDDLLRYENYSLLVLSTLYGVELLEDNAQKCVMNMYQVYYEAYQQQAIKNGRKVKNKVLDSAKLIISNNIVQGNFLTKLSTAGNPIVLSEWKPLNFHKGVKTIRIQRTEYTLLDILGGIKKEGGEPLTYLKESEQLDLFDFLDDKEIAKKERKQMKYIAVKVTDVYREEMEEVDE